MRPKLSVAITAYDSFDILCETLNKLHWQITNPYEVEVLVRNDNPELDDTDLKQMCEYAHFNYAKNPENIGESRSRQQNLLDAKGEYVTWIDADDSIENNYIETILTELELYGKMNPKADIIMHQWHFIDGRLGDQHPKPLANWNVWANVYRLDLVRDVQFDPLQVYSSDYFWLEKVVKEKNPNIYYSGNAVNIYNDRNENSLTRRFQRGEIKARLDE